MGDLLRASVIESTACTKYSYTPSVLLMGGFCAAIHACTAGVFCQQSCATSSPPRWKNSSVVTAVSSPSSAWMASSDTFLPLASGTGVSGLLPAGPHAAEQQSSG
jgi:hypothetical protein